MTDPAYLHPIGRSPIPIGDVVGLGTMLEAHTQAINDQVTVLNELKHSLTTVRMLFILAIVSVWLPWIVGWLRWLL